MNFSKKAVNFLTAAPSVPLLNMFSKTIIISVQSPHFRKTCYREVNKTKKKVQFGLICGSDGATKMVYGRNFFPPPALASPPSGQISQIRPEVKFDMYLF